MLFEFASARYRLGDCDVAAYCSTPYSANQSRAAWQHAHDARLRWLRMQMDGIARSLGLPATADDDVYVISQLGQHAHEPLD